MVLFSALIPMLKTVRLFSLTKSTKVAVKSIVK